MIMESYESDESNNSSITNIEPERNTTLDQARLTDGDLGDFLDPELTLVCNTYKKSETFSTPWRPTTSRKIDKERKNNEDDCLHCKNSTEPYCHVELGLTKSIHTEKVEIVQGCAHADICNVFEDLSIVVTYISWPCKYEHYGDVLTQSLTASLLYKLAQIEEGRRYLNYNSKITNDLKKVIRRKSSMLEMETIESLNATLNLLNPPLTQNLNITYYYKPIDEGIGKKTLNALIDYRQYMTLDEVFAQLDLMLDLSNRDTGKFELISNLPHILLLFKQLLVEYDNSEINIVLTKILTNILTKNIGKEKMESDAPKALTIADIATEV
ncbi:unnamed protein product [Diatraea saccharalis]|uniref:Uncharacterized protein n=1 Tax=Diatraea saccharalis TaxID=40085 RepID=A0A9N9R0Z1_9NEOP|nr:unnamed protein product [Diatraea saccharalis]